MCSVETLNSSRRRNRLRRPCLSYLPYGSRCCQTIKHVSGTDISVSRQCEYIRRSLQSRPRKESAWLSGVNDGVSSYGGVIVVVGHDVVNE